MKKFLSIVLILLVMLFSNVYARDAVVQLNGEIVDFTDENGNVVNAQIINNRTMVPLRKIFELLGCEIEWDEPTKTVTANKNDTQIVLQINNKQATKTVNGNVQEITLDTPPVLSNNRTLVPLRFVAESLEKQVGWEASSYTAIIIDYDYFADMINQKNSNLYNILSSNGDTSFSITRDYTDKENSANSNTATLRGTITKNEDTSSVSLTFEGNNELIKDIIDENWNIISYDVKYDGNKFLINTSNEILLKILNLQENTCNLEELNLVGNLTDNLGDYIKNIFSIDDSSLNSNTFANMKADFEKFISLFVENGTHQITAENTNLSLIDFAKFDNIVYNNELMKNLSLINKKIFSYDITKDEVLYDWPQMNYEMNSQNNNLLLKITLENEYNEKVVYTISVS